MAKVKTLGTYYEPGSFSVTQKHKRGEQIHYNKRGAHVNPLGFGNATEVTTSHYYLFVETKNGETASVRIDRYFKDRGKKFTEKRRCALEACRPEKVHLETAISDFGNKYTVVVENDMFAWCKDAGIN